MKKKIKRQYFDVLRGTLDDNNPLSKLRAKALIWTTIFLEIDNWYKEHIDTDNISFKRIPFLNYDENYNTFEEKIKFPEPTNININMMPIIMNAKFIPEYLHSYYNLIKHLPIPHYDLNNLNQDGYYEKKVLYLTIHESYVSAGEFQRRPGLHIERPSSIGGRFIKRDYRDIEYRSLAWGLGYHHEAEDGGIAIDGIYMASNVENSCKIWPIQIKNPHEITDGHGGIEHMRDHIGDGEILKANEMYWLTDTTPHESLPLKNTYRQFLRLIVGRISVWYSKHNTPNPLGIVPQSDVIISDIDKFEPV